MAEDKGKEEEKFDFTAEGEGYISLAEARVLAMQTASSVPGDYGRSFRGVAMVFEVAESGEDADYYNITLSFRPQGNFDGTPGQEQFLIGKESTIALRQVLASPVRKGGGFPVIPVAIGLVVVGIVAAVGAVFVLMGSGGDSVPIAAVPPTEATVNIDATVEAGIQQGLEERPTSVPVLRATDTPIPTYYTLPPTPTRTLPPPPRPTPTDRVIVVAPTFTPSPAVTSGPGIAGYFTVGSTKDEVLAAQGTPDDFSDTAWYYQISVVYFENGRVTSWKNTGVDELKVRMTPSSSVGSGLTYFTVGSTKDEVLAAQGTPDDFSDTAWYYQISVVYFENGRVTSWKNTGVDELKVRGTP